MKLFTTRKSITIGDFEDWIIEEKKVNVSDFLRKSLRQLIKDDFPEIRHINTISRWLKDPLKAIKEIVSEDLGFKLSEFSEDVKNLLKTDDVEISLKLYADIEDKVNVGKRGLEIISNPRNHGKSAEEENTINMMNDAVRIIDFLRIIILEKYEKKPHHKPIKENKAFYSKVLYLYTYMMEGFH